MAGKRIIEPSSCISSDRAAAGFIPASAHRSTAASVWPARRSTPPWRARSGNTWPGRARSAALTPSRIAAWMVVARSLALMPVVTPSLASMVTVKAVLRRAVLWATIGGRSSRSACWSVSARHTTPPV